MTRCAHTLARPLIFLPGLAVAMAIAGLATLLILPAPEAAAAIVAPAVPPTTAKAASGRDRTCDSCGYVVTIRGTSADADPATYKFTVRMRDGSTRDSTAATRGSWAEGDRVILIGGTAARALEEEQNAIL